MIGRNVAIYVAVTPLDMRRSSLTSELTSVPGALAKPAKSPANLVAKVVETPGVEARGETGGFVRSRDGSGKSTESLRDAEASRNAISHRLAALRCSSEVEGSEPEGESLKAPEREWALAKLDATEHVLEAVLALLEVGAVQSATALLRGWRSGGEGESR